MTFNGGTGFTTSFRAATGRGQIENKFSSNVCIVHRCTVLICIKKEYPLAVYQNNTKVSRPVAYDGWKSEGDAEKNSFTEKKFLHQGWLRFNFASTSNSIIFKWAFEETSPIFWTTILKSVRRRGVTNNHSRWYKAVGNAKFQQFYSY